MNPPYYYDYLNAKNGMINPSTIKVRNTSLARFFEKYLLEKAISRFKFTLPKEWAENYFQYVLFCLGYIGVINTDKYGVIPQDCTLSGYNVFYQPSRILVTNPLLKSDMDLVIGYNAEIIKLQPCYSGIMDIVEYYGEMMALTSASLGVNILNSRLAYVFLADTPSVAESFKKMTDRILSGEPAVVVDKKLRDGIDGDFKIEFFNNALKNNFIATELMSVLRDIERQFCNEVGIPNYDETKRERISVDEVNMNNEETYSMCQLWLETMHEDIERVNKMFGTDISVELREEKKGGMSSGIENNANGALSV